MVKPKPLFLNLFLSLMTCLVLIGISLPSFSQSVMKQMPGSQEISSFTAAQIEQIVSVQGLINQHVAQNWQEAESVLLAQGMMDNSMKRYRAMLSKDQIVGNMPMAAGLGTAGAVLVGNRLIIRGDFSGLSSGLRDYATDPLNPPNPNITSAIHIHRGAATENGPFQYALQVTLDKSGMGGRFAGNYTLTDEQLQALNAGRLYVDLHTKQNRAGELRGVLQPS